MIFRKNTKGQSTIRLEAGKTGLYCIPGLLLAVSFHDLMVRSLCKLEPCNKTSNVGSISYQTAELQFSHRIMLNAFSRLEHKRNKPISVITVQIWNAVEHFFFGFCNLFRIFNFNFVSFQLVKDHDSCAPRDL